MWRRRSDLRCVKRDKTHQKNIIPALNKLSQAQSFAAAKDFSSSKWHNVRVRALFCVLMLSGFIQLTYGGAIALTIMVFLVQGRYFYEVISIGFQLNSFKGRQRYVYMAWYFLIIGNYFFFADFFIEHFVASNDQKPYLQLIWNHHDLICFGLYCIGFTRFVASLGKKFYIKKFSILAWIHLVALQVLVFSFLIVQNIFTGLIWFIVPMCMVICNDIAAYLFGLFFGRSPLIELSPNKTWEGFIGGGLCTVVFGSILSFVLCQYQYFLCPTVNGNIDMNCDAGDMFKQRLYTLPVLDYQFKMYPFVWHSLILGLFSSTISPFGGFFASGLKRACNIKDYGNIIPGHGGVVDRFDCQLLMGAFVNVYITSFNKATVIDRILLQIDNLQDDKDAFFEALKDRYDVKC